MFQLIKDNDVNFPNTVATLPETGNFKSPGDFFAEKKNPFSYTEDIIRIKPGCSIDLFDGEKWLVMPNREEIEIDPALNLDVGAELVPGTDYFGYLCIQGSGAARTPVIVYSPNATFPNGFSAETSRKFHGFHYGTIRKISDDGKWVPIDSTGNKFGNSGTKWQDNVTLGIIPNSIWDLKNRPRIIFGGLVKVGGIWVSIYTASAKQAITFMSGSVGLHVAEGELQSKYGQIPVTGTEGLCQYNFVELAGRSGMRLLSYQEWLQAAYGSPQGEDGSNNYGWTRTNNAARTRTGCMVDPNTGNYDISIGVKPYAVSAHNVVDCTGNVWDWLSDYSNRHDSTSWNWQNVLGTGMGQAYLPNSTGIVAYIAGGHWNSGVYCGPRAVGVSDYPWHRYAGVGSRLACDAA
jgi:hypothetical protein